MVAVDHGHDERLDYPSEVADRLVRTDLDDHRRVADRLNRSVDVVLLQHEYGIFGGPSGRNLLELIDALRVPLVTTLHTVLPDPTPVQRQILARLLDRSAQTVVMTERGRSLLISRFGAAPDRISVIPHGVPNIAPVAPAEARRQLGLPEAPTVLSFGLLGPSKRLELILEAMAQLDEETSGRFVILGATHPEVRRRHGEAYRTSLQTLAADLNIAHRVTFVDRFVDPAELITWLQASDIFVTAYANPQQATSGTLSYAVAAGRPVIATPYAHARELLADDRGILVPFDDAEALSAALERLLRDDELRAEIGDRARTYGRSMRWPIVGERYRRTLANAAGATARRPVSARIDLADGPRHPLPGIVRRHLSVLSSSSGIWQHANGLTPDARHGTCTDDVARALRVDMAHQQAAPSAVVAGSMAANLAYLEQAFSDPVVGFRNFRAADGRWLEESGSDDCHGRALWALGEVVANSDDRLLVLRARRLADQALPRALGFTDLRPRCYAILGTAAVLRVDRAPEHQEALRTLVAGVLNTLPAGDQEWPWPEATVTYDNGIVPHALLVAGEVDGQPAWVARGAHLLSWLFSAQLSERGWLRPIGNLGWWPRDGQPAQFDQQPIEAGSLLEAADNAHRITGQRSWTTLMERCYAWFVGDNDLGISLAEPAIGACHDGLGPTGRNPNCGAESTLAWLLAVERIRTMRADWAPPPPTVREPAKVPA